MSGERWRWVKGYEGLYMVSDRGRVMSVPVNQVRGNMPYKKPGMELVHSDNGKGYRILSLYRDGKGCQMTVHRLVAEAFIPNPDNKPDVNHIDGDKANNNASNLEWVTKSENMQHAVNVLDAMGFNRIFDEDDILSIRADTRTEREIADDYGVCQRTINAIRIGKTYKTFGGEKKRVGRSRQRKFTPDDVRAIRASNEPNVVLANRYGVADTTISKIKRNKVYKEVK